MVKCTPSNTPSVVTREIKVIQVYACPSFVEVNDTLTTG